MNANFVEIDFKGININKDTKESVSKYTMSIFLHHKNEIVVYDMITLFHSKF